MPDSHLVGMLLKPSGILNRLSVRDQPTTHNGRKLMMLQRQLEHIGNVPTLSML